jgi:DDE superfamily endonuclease
VYREAPTLEAQGERVVSTDELTGVQALERKHPSLPMMPGQVERREFEYIRHGTCALIVSRDVVSGQMIAPSAGPTRTEADFLAHMQGVVATDPTATRWHVVVDNLDIHRSASLVCWVAAESGLDLDLGVKGKCGILHNRQSRAALLRASRTIASCFTIRPAIARGLTRSRSGSASWCASCSSVAPFPRWRISRPRSWHSSTTTTGRWPSPSSGPTRASHWWPNRGSI